MFAAVLNRPGSLGPLAGKRSRGELPLLALEAGSAGGSAERLARLDASEYRTFNLVVADRSEAYFVRGGGAGRPHVAALGPGIHVVTAHDPNDPASPRARAYRPRFERAAPPDPERGDWREWMALLSSRSGPRGAAINVPADAGFGTVCSSLAGVSSEGRALWLFAAGPPDVAPFHPLTLP